jgi:2-polyprenyl-6-hydroxyphenyl methylase/3-demethylubiquinone-9 3-methyltransferase
MDVAAAQGNFSLTLCESGYRVIWNDLRKDLIGYVQLKYQKGDIQYYAGNCFDIDLKNELLDAVIITEIIEHVAHPDVFLKKIASMLKPNGLIFMSTPLGSYFVNKLPRFSECPDPSIYESVQFKPNSDGHIFLLHEDEIKTLGANAGLEIVETFICNNVLTSGHRGTHLLLKVLPEKFVMSVEKLTQNLPQSLRRKINASVSVVYRKASD